MADISTPFTIYPSGVKEGVNSTVTITVIVKDNIGGQSTMELDVLVRKLFATYLAVVIIEDE